jgi:regulator of protease activity HflC (stomatin/prohibitin superfamily)
MEKRTQSNGLINLLALLFLGVAALGLSRYGNVLSGMVAGAFMGVGAMVAAVGWFQMRLEEREHLEKLEFQELTKSASSSALFNPNESEVFPAQRSREQFEKYFLPVFTILLFIAQVGGAFYFLRQWKGHIPVALVDPTVPLALFGVFALLFFLLGKYAAGIARIEKIRLLRPGSSYMLLCAYACFAVSAGIAAVLFDFTNVDMQLARVMAVVLGLTGVETVINLILEIYRPRVKGRGGRLLYESRLVSLLGQPEGLISTAAETLDYQFGFKVSETWAYRSFEKYFPWIVIGQLAVLLASTCFVFIDAGEQAVLERNGAFVRVMTPGLGFKLPWPIDRTYRYPTEQIQRINVGFVPEDSPATGNLILWTTSHNKEENFLVANRELPALEDSTNSPSGALPPPVSLLTVSIPVQFQVTNLSAWVYNNEDPVSLLSHISSREVVRFFVSADLHEIMSKARWDAGETLRARIQAEADRHAMGASILFVGLQDIHPPVKVAGDYEKVVAAIHTREAAILAAQADAIKSTNLAVAQAFQTVTLANSDSLTRRVDAIAKAALFTNQLPAYRASPSVYAERAYLETFSRAVTNARTYVILATNTQDVVILDLEDKIGRNLMNDLTVPPPKQNK